MSVDEIAPRPGSLGAKQSSQRNLRFFGVGVVLNTTWFVKIVKGAYKVLFGSSQKKQA